MKRIALMVLLSVLVALTSCAAYYGSEKQYDSGNHYFLARSAELARIKQDKLALKKLRVQPVQTSYINEEGNLEKVSAGYKGLVANLSTSNRYNFIIRGPETKSYYLGPGQRVIDYLIPGTYTREIHHGTYLVSKPKVFHVNSQLHHFLNEKYHWYIGAEY